MPTDQPSEAVAAEAPAPPPAPVSADPVDITGVVDDSVAKLAQLRSHLGTPGLAASLKSINDAVSALFEAAS